MIGTTTKNKVCRQPRPSALPTSVPTRAAMTVPAASGTKIFRKPLTSTARSMLKMLPTMIEAMNR